MLKFYFFSNVHDNNHSNYLHYFKYKVWLSEGKMAKINNKVIYGYRIEASVASPWSDSFEYPHSPTLPERDLDNADQGNRNYKYVTNIKPVISDEMYYCSAPPLMLVLWWIPFHTTTFWRPVVTLSPTVNVSRRSKASSNKHKVIVPSALFGKYATRVVPLYFW